MLVTVAGVSYTGQCAGHTNDTQEWHYITQDRGAVFPLQCKVQVGVPFAVQTPTNIPLTAI